MVKAQHGSVQHGSFQHGYEATNASGTATADVDASSDASASFGVSGTAEADVDASGKASAQLLASGSATVDVDASGRATSPVSASGTATISVSASGAAQSGFSASGTATIDVNASGNALVVIRPIRVGDIVADELVDQPVPSQTLGDTVTLQLLFRDGGLPEGYIQPDTVENRYQAARNYLKSASDAALDSGTDDTGNPWFRERLPDNAAVSTLLGELNTSEILDIDLENSYVVIEDVTDQSNSGYGHKRVDVTVRTLGYESDFADLAAARDATEVTLGWLVGGNIADALTDDAPPTLTRGETITRTFRFGDLSNGAYQDLRDLLAYPAVSTWTTDSGIPRFRERIPSIAPTNTAVVKVDPDNDSDAGFEPFWALVTSGDDSGPPRPDERQLDLELAILGTVSEYADETALRNALESDPVGGT